MEELIAGVDEAGRGPLAGPVVAAAVILPISHKIKGLRDSKKISKNKREKLCEIIMEIAISVGVGEVDEKVIDTINIRQATFKAMQIALSKLSPQPNRALIDGEKLPNQIIPNVGIIGGDNIEDSIKAASIVAKVTRDRIMKEYSIIFPEYGFEKHNGYGTKYHINALDQYKATPFHRRSYKPVKVRMPTFNWLIKNNRIQWLGEKVGILFLKKKGMRIHSINTDCSPEKNINVIAKEKNMLVCINILTEIFVNKSNIDTDFILNEAKLLKLSYLNQLSKVFSETDKVRFDYIIVTLKKKEEPNIQYLKDIKHI